MIKMSTELDRVKQWLLSKWSISAPSDWLNACLDWLHEEAQEILSAIDVNEHVYEQWLLSDLRQIGAACLPGDLPETQKTDLRGCFCLQVNSIVDVSTSCYSQLQKLQGTDNENVHVTATQFTQTQVKSNRVLMMKMSDGSVEVQGMEYQPIPCLHSGLSPGIKIQIRGPVLCRLGVLMLKRDNVRILGGEVEELVTENSPQLLLQRALNCESGEGQTAPQRRQPPSLGVSEGGNSVQDRSGHRRSTRGMDDSRDEHVAVPRKRMRRSSTERAVDASLDGLSAELLDAMDEEWDRDDLMDDFAPQSHMNVKASTTSHDNGHMTRVSMTNHNSSNTELGEYGRHKRPPPRQQINTTLQRDAVKWPRVTSGGHNGTDSRATKFKSEPFQDFHSDNQTSHPTATKTTGETSDRMDSEEFIDLTQTETSNESNHNSSVRAHIPPCGTETVSSAFTAHSIAPVDGATVSAMTSHSTSYEVSMPVTKVCCRYTYLSEIHWPPTDTHEVHIKAYVSTLVSKLDHGGGSKWSLRVKLNDGSAVMDCDLANEMLTSLIGFSASESLKMKQIAKKDKGVRKHLMEGLMQCQQSLIQMSCIMVLQLDPDRPRPYVLRYRAPTVQDWEALQERIC